MWPKSAGSPTSARATLILRWGELRVDGLEDRRADRRRNRQRRMTRGAEHGHRGNGPRPACSRQEGRRGDHIGGAAGH
eukprot:9775749-Alexandrium_andersonii.AAC.1